MQLFIGLEDKQKILSILKCIEVEQNLYGN